MHCYYLNSRRTVGFRLTVLTVLLCFGINLIGPVMPAFAQTIAAIPLPSVMVIPTPDFTPAVLRGLKIHPDNPFEFEFIIDTAQTGLSGADLEGESARLIKYFLASLTVPENDLWVNLSPNEEDRIIAPQFGTTEMGRDMLAQDYLLKQFAASLMYPEGETGRIFWERVYQRAQQEFGTTNIPINTFNKVWIVPQTAKVYESEDGAYVLETRLKVMLEDEYARSSDLVSAPKIRATVEPNIAAELVKEVLIPEIEREVNEGKHFAQLRQIYHSLVLATWYKRTLKNSILNQKYADQNKVAGVDLKGDNFKEEIYQQYMQAFRKGVYNYIKEDYDPYTGSTVPRNYFSGGLEFRMPALDQATLSEAKEFLKTANPNQWKNVMTRLRRPQDWDSSRGNAAVPAPGRGDPDAAILAWGKKPGDHGVEGLRVSPEPSMTLSPAEIDKLRAAQGRPRDLDAGEMLHLRDVLLESDNLYQSSQDVNYTQDPLLNRLDFSRRGSRSVLFSQIGSLFLIDRAFYLELDQEVRDALGPNALVLDGLNDLEMYQPERAEFTNALMSLIQLRQDWPAMQVIDVGAGEGVLGLIAHKMGAPFIDVFDNDVDKLEIAKNQFRLNGLVSGADYRLHAGDLANAEYLADRIQQIHRQLDESGENRSVAVISNVGFWPRSRFSDGEPQYTISNDSALEMASRIPAVSLILLSGYNVHNVRQYEKGIRKDFRRLSDMGFRRDRRAVHYFQTDMMMALSAVKPDAAIFANVPGRLQSWLQARRENSRKALTVPAWGRAKEMAEADAQQIMNQIITQNDLHRVVWDEELKSGQTYGYFELAGQRLIREEAYLKHRSGPGELVVVRMGHLFLMDRSYYLNLSDSLKELLGSNVILIRRLHDSSLNSQFFRIYNSSTAMALIAEGSLEGHHVVDAGSGDGLLALIAYKLGASFVELLEYDHNDILRADHHLILNGLVPDEDFSMHLGDITDDEFAEAESKIIFENMYTSGARYLTVVSNIGSWDYYGDVSNIDSFNLMRYLPPVDVFIGGGYDVTDSERNREVVSADAAWLLERGYTVNDNRMTLAGTGRTVALIATRQDGAMLGQLERMLQDELTLPADKLEHSVVEINGRKIEVTQYRNAQFEEVPYFRVGDVLVVNQAVLDGLSTDQRSLLEAYPGVIILGQREFTDAFAYERLEGYGGFTIGVIASMQAFREQIADQTFVDFGAGTGVLSIVASRLGARDVIVIEGREDVQDVLTANLKENGVINVQRLEQVIESVDALTTTEAPVFALNLPYFGLLAGSGEPSNALRKAFELVPDPTVAIVSGGSFGRGAIDDYVMKMLGGRGAATVIESLVMKEKVSDIDLAVSNVFTAVYRSDILRPAGGDQAILSHASRQKYLQRFIGLVDRYIDRIPPQFPHPTGPVQSLIQNNPYFEDFLKALDIEVVIPPQLQRQGFWKYELALDPGEQRRLMDLLANPERIPDGKMPEKWSVVFYKQEPLLLLMEGVGWNIFSEEMRMSIIEQHTQHLLYKGITEAGMRMYMDGIARLKWARAISLIPVKTEAVSLADKRNLAMLAKWVDAVSDGPVLLADALFDDTPIRGISSRMVTSWGSYDARDLDATIFRSGINPNPGDLVYVLGTGMGADAVYAAERVGGDIRIIATDIDPYLVGNARTNVAVSPYAHSIRVLQANLFDFAKDADEKADRIYFNIPIDSLVAGRKKDPRTGDPGMQLLQRLLGEAAGHLKKDGSLEINYMARPSFFQHVYNLGWEVVDIEGQEIFDQLENAQLQAWKYLRYTLKRQDPRRKAMYDEALKDLRTLSKMEKTLLLTMTTDAGRNEGERGTGTLSQKNRDRKRDEAQAIVRRWHEPSDMLNRVMRQTADGVWWLAKTSMHFNPRFVPRSRLNNPRFTMVPNPLSIMQRIEDQSMLASDDLAADSERLIGIDAAGRHDQAQLSETARARELGRRVQNHLSALQGETQSIDVQEAVDQILANYALVKGDVVAVNERENGTRLGGELRRGIESQALSQRLIVQRLANQLDAVADRMFKRKRRINYPKRINYQYIGALIKERRGARPRSLTAKEIGIGDASLKRIEDWSDLEGKDIFTGGNNVNLGTFLSVLNYYQIHMEQLFGREPQQVVFAPYVADHIPGNISFHRQRQDWTIDQAASRLKVDRRNYDKWESGEKTPTFHSLVMIARALNATMDELLRENLVLNHDLLRVTDAEQWVYLHDRFAMADVRSRLRNLRLQRGLSTYQVAEALGKSQTYVSELENGQYDDYSIERLRVMAKFYGVDLFYLISGLNMRTVRPEVYAQSVNPGHLRQNLKAVREFRGFAQRDVDRLAGFSIGYVSSLERVGTPRLANFIKWAEVLQVPIDLLLGDPVKLESYLAQEQRYQTLGHQLRITREKAGISLEDISAILEIPEPRLRRIEQGRILESRVRDLVAIANYLQEDFLGLFMNGAGQHKSGRDKFQPFVMGEDYEQEFGLQFKKLLRDHALSQPDFAEEAGLSLSGVVSPIAIGRRQFLLSELLAISKYFDMTLSDLMRLPADVVADSAALGEAPGGIDFRSDRIDLEIEGNGAALPMEFDLQNPQTIQIEGLIPVIINITPVTSLPLLLGFKADAAEPLADLGSPQESPFTDPRDRRIADLQSI